MKIDLEKSSGLAKKYRNSALRNHGQGGMNRSGGREMLLPILSPSPRTFGILCGQMCCNGILSGVATIKSPILHLNTPTIDQKEMAFPDLHTIEPRSVHTHTVILLHGRSGNGPEFAEELLNSKTSEETTLIAKFPNCRWVFPTSRERWCSAFQRDLTAWFDVYSLSNTADKQDLQIDGLRESMLYILEVMDQEIDLLGGRLEKVVLGGFSLGMATALWTLLCSAGRFKGKIGAFIGMCGWLPFANEIEDIQFPNEMIPKLLLDTIRCEEQVQASTAEAEAMLSTPVFLVHGADDTLIDVEVGRRVHRILTGLGMKSGWAEYVGAEKEGHWIKEPEGFDAIVQFLDAICAS
ncbi:hypothetical protein H101_02828 [Trichophyton interdigitale H6]|nr:hypothetical protein H101_02828 [Trichophyton interdigitale H6]